MKRLLSAMAALALVAGLQSPAYASGWKLGFSGLFSGVGSWFGQSAGGKDSNHTAAGADAQIHVDGKRILNNGIQIGLNGDFVIKDDCALAGQRAALGLPVDETNSSCVSNRVNRVYVEFTTGLGRVQAGQQYGVGRQMMVATPSPFTAISADATTLSPLALSNIDTVLDDSGYGSKFIYMSPRVFGLQAGVSYLWDPNHNGPLPVLSPTTPIPGTNGTQGFQAALNWEHYFFNDIAVRGALVYYTDSRKGGARDPVGYNLGLQLGFKGFTVGGNYTAGDNMDHRTTYVDMAKTNIWSAGVSWGMGRWLLGLDYADGVDKLGNLSADYTSVVTGLRYQFAPGIQVGVGYQHDKASPLSGTGAHGNAVFVETGLKF